VISGLEDEDEGLGFYRLWVLPVMGFTGYGFYRLWALQVMGFSGYGFFRLWCRVQSSYSNNS